MRLLPLDVPSIPVWAVPKGFFLAPTCRGSMSIHPNLHDKDTHAHIAYDLSPYLPQTDQILTHPYHSRHRELHRLLLRANTVSQDICEDNYINVVHVGNTIRIILVTGSFTVCFFGLTPSARTYVRTITSMLSMLAIPSGSFSSPGALSSASSISSV